MIRDFVVIFIVLVIGSLVALAGSQGSIYYNGYPPQIICMRASFLINWIILITSYLNKT